MIHDGKRVDTRPNSYGDTVVLQLIYQFGGHY
jgi:hypothetical protein